MQSPFPGMDPYIEVCHLWEDFHHSLISEIQRVLADILPDHYVVLTGERSYIVLTVGGSIRERQMQADVGVALPPGARERIQPSGGTAVAEVPQAQTAPRTMHALVEVEYREPFLEIRELRPGRKLITCIEVLSPSNKRFGSKGWYKYSRKRQVYLEGNANLVEIDLLRRGRRMPMEDEWPDSPYYILVSRQKRAPECQVWEGHFLHALPTIPVPLAPPDPDLPLSLQPLIHAIYARSRYSQSIDYRRPLHPRFNAAESAWWEQRLREWQASK